jgi:selenocysteine lyase/cysteine desulfurase
MPTSLDRRRFLGVFAYPAAFAGLAAIAPTLSLARGREILAELAAAPGSAAGLAGDEDFWSQVALAFTIDRSIINLNNGGVSPAPAVVQEAMKKHLDFSNQMPPPIALWKILEPQKETVRERLARHWKVSPEEIAITRNSSESLQICQLGFDLKPGDEIVCTTQDYPRMVTTFKQRARRDGLTFSQFKIPIPCESDEEFLKLYDKAITPKTRLLLISHIINITGQILPVRKIVELARSKNGGVPVIVDGAHAMAHFEFSLPDLGCDYYGVSLHKWLAAPHGTGLLYVRRDKINGLWPMQAAEEKVDTDIRKFEEIGTHPAANFLAIAEALTFHQAIGDARKEARLRYLRDGWAKRLLSHPSGRVKLHTSLKPQYSCGIGTVQIEGIDSAKLADWLMEKHKILAVGIKHEEFEGLRVTPNVYTTMEEIERFCEAMEIAIEKGIGG